MKRLLGFVVLLMVVLVLAVLVIRYPSGRGIPGFPVTGGVVPDFRHIFIVVLENTESHKVLSGTSMPYFNELSSKYTLLNQYYAIDHPSLPNYLSLVGGDTFGINSDCSDCDFEGVSIADLIEKTNRTWKSYAESMPSNCYQEAATKLYAKRHNPFIYFNNIRTNYERCQRSIVTLDQLDTDLKADNLPNYAFITPNLCNDGHDCGLSTVDQWLSTWIPKLMANPSMQKNGLIVITFDEGTSQDGCCGIRHGGGKVATLLVSNLVKTGFVDNTPYNHYSLVRTISMAWGMPLLGHSGDLAITPIITPWKED